MDFTPFPHFGHQTNRSPVPNPQNFKKTQDQGTKIKQYKGLSLTDYQANPLFLIPTPLNPCIPICINIFPEDGIRKKP